MNKCKLFTVTALVAALTIPTMASSALVGRLADSNGNYQAYYDTEADLTWLSDANYAQTSGYDSDGLMSWADANAWAAGLDLAGVTGWRLPDTLQPDTSCHAQWPDGTSFGFNCIGSEIGNFFYNVLGGVAGQPITTTHNNANYDLFSNIQSSIYWTATEYVSDTGYAWAFVIDDGYQGISDKADSFYAWAVQSGDVGVSAVPVPAAVWLFGSGLIGLVGFARKKK